MSVFIDTSAFLAILNHADQNHVSAKAFWTELIQNEERIICTNYILVESFALIQHRLGMAAVRAYQRSVVPILEVAWLEPEDHRAAVSLVLTANRWDLSLVDCASFDTMRRLAIETAFTFDPHFSEQGFIC